MKKITLFLCLIMSVACQAQQMTNRFNFSDEKAKEGHIQITPQSLYNPEIGYGYDLIPAPDKKGNSPWYFSVSVPDGNYKVTVKIGSKKKAGSTTVRAESRRLFINNLSTKKGEIIEKSFIVNKRNTQINEHESVQIKPREKAKLNWDDKLTLEVNGDAPQITSVSIEKVDSIPTVFLCGNSTVVDQDEEPWASWGQMIPGFFTDQIAFANYAESGESANTFIGAGRLKKILTGLKEGDYLFIEFGHNDQKQKGPGKGAFYSYMTSLKTFIDEARLRGGIPVLVTPTQRRSFNAENKIVDTHEDFPEAMKWLANKEGVPLIDLHAMTRTLYEALGPEESKKAFVHYPANTFTNQPKALEDNTHFNPYGAYEIAKCVVEGIKAIKLPLKNEIIPDFRPYSPAKPDPVQSFHWNPSPFMEPEKPDGN